MKNIQMTATHKKLTIVIDLTQDFGESKSGKSITVATTGGNQSVPDNPDIKIGINVFKKK